MDLGTFSGNAIEGVGAEGNAYDKYKNPESRFYKAAYSDDSNDNRIAYDTRGYTSWFWLRTSYLAYPTSAVVVTSSGSIQPSSCNNTDGPAFGFCIDTIPTYTTQVNATNITVSVLPEYVGPEGTTYQYQINGGEWKNARLTTDSTHTFTGLTPSTIYTVNVKIGNDVQKPQTVTTAMQKTMKEVSTVEEAIKYSATAISATDTSYSGIYKELTDSTGATVKVPVGFTVRYDSAATVADGIVVADQNDNQWVWIPVNASNTYERRNLKTSAGYSNYSETLTGVEVNVATVGGYYIARYEAGVSGATAMRSTKTSAQTVSIKRDQVPYNYIAINSTIAESGHGDCITLASGIATTNNYKTGITTKLCSSYAWDTALNFIENESWSKGTGTGYQSIRQNYYDSATFKYLKYNNGSLTTADKTTNSSDGVMLTGQGNATKNIYDMGGNCKEYTTESYADSSYPYVYRGGVFDISFRVDPAGERSYYSGHAYGYIGFRPTLYLSGPVGLNSSNITFDYSTTNWTNQNIIVGVTVDEDILGDNTLRYKIGPNGTWTDYNATNKINVTENNTIYVAIFDGNEYSVSATTDITKIDKTLPIIDLELNNSSVTDDTIITNIRVKDLSSGLGKIIWYYKNKTAENWTSNITTYKAPGANAGVRIEQSITHKYEGLIKGDTYQFYAEVYDVAGNMMVSKSLTNPLEIECSEIIKYAVQIYGINEDEDASGNTLGLTFGPATFNNVNNKYITHSYRPSGNGDYHVVVEVHTVLNDGIETISTSNLRNSAGWEVTRTAEEMEKYNVNLHDMSWEEIAAVSDKTVFTDCMLCGDTKSVRLKLNNDIKNSDANILIQTGDGAGVLYDAINDKYKKWNPSISDNAAATNGGDYGSNAKNAGGYASSHIRATLIGMNAKTDITYAGNENLTTSTCLYSCIESELRNIISAKKIKYVTGTDYTTGNYNLNDDVEDEIWLFSEKEVNCAGTYTGDNTEGIGTSGLGYSKFRNPESGFNATGTYLIIHRASYKENGVYGKWWLRSPKLNTNDYTYSVINTGAAKDYYANSTENGLTFGFCIE